MSDLVTDPSDPRLGRGVNTSPVPQNAAYLVLSEEERAKGFIRPYRDAYKHVGRQPKYPLRDLTQDEKARYARFNYVKYEEYPADSTVLGMFWTEEQLNTTGCGHTTTMSKAIAETYARDPKFYGATYCAHCKMHRPLEEFNWLDGTRLGS